MYVPYVLIDILSYFCHTRVQKKQVSINARKGVIAAIVEDRMAHFMNALYQNRIF